jgi:hypothetical protein
VRPVPSPHHPKYIVNERAGAGAPDRHDGVYNGFDVVPSGSALVDIPVRSFVHCSMRAKGPSIEANS